MRQMRHDAGLDADQTLVAQWETTGNDWIALYRYTSERWGIVYAYRTPNGGGSLNCNPALDPMVFGPVPASDEAAIAEMERPWNGGNGRGGAGAAFVLQADRPSLRRVR